MQRMKLHLSGVKVPKLGSLHDRIYREYMTKESQLEAEKMKLVMMTTMMTPTFDDAGRAREWSEKIKTIWSSYLALQYCVEIPEKNEREMEMLEYYSTVVKHLKPTIEKTKEGGIVKGLSALSR